MKKLMAVFAHPDDEGAMGGTLAQYAAQGVAVTLVCATRGEVGEISDPSLATPETLGAVREGELRAACDVLGIQPAVFMDYRDSGMEGTPENGDAGAFVQADPTVVIGQLVGLIREQRPDVVVTFEPFGWYGHPDHVATSRWVTEAFPLAGDGEAYPDKGAAWGPARLFYSVIPFSTFGALIQEAVDAGVVESSGFLEHFPMEQQLRTEAAVTHVLDVNAYYERKEAAREKHRTQFSEEGIFSKIPREKLKPVWGYEHFIQVYPQPVRSASDLPGLQNPAALKQDLFGDG